MKFWDEKSKKLLTKEEMEKKAEKAKEAAEEQIEDIQEKDVAKEEEVPMMGEDESLEKETAKKSKK